MQLKGDAHTLALNKFDAQVNRECHKYLADSVPRYDERKRVTLLTLRSLWQDISFWMFCSPQQDSEAFIRQYLVRGSSAGEMEYRRFRLIANGGRSIEQIEGTRGYAQPGTGTSVNGG